MANFIQRPRLFNPTAAYQQGQLARNQLDAGQITNQMNAFNLQQAQKMAPVQEQQELAALKSSLQKMDITQRKQVLETANRVRAGIDAYLSNPNPQEYAAFRSTISSITGDDADLPEVYDPNRIKLARDKLDWELGEVQRDLQLTEIGVPGGQSQRAWVDPSRPDYVRPIGTAYTKKPLMQIGPDVIPQVPGLPEPATAPWSNIRDPKKRDDAKMRYGASAQKKLDKMQEEVNSKVGMNADLERFLYLNANNYTGKWMNVPGASSARGVFDPEFEEMESISDKLTPAMRQGMPGAASDRDVAMFKSATVSTTKRPETNENIAKGMIAANQNYLDRQEFMQDYLANYGHLNGADKQWKNYLQANPIFDPMEPPGSYKLNEKRRTYTEYFGSMGEASDLYRKYGLER